MSRANNYTWEDLGQVVGPQGPAGPAGGGSIAEKKDFSGSSYDPLSGQHTNKTKDQILNEVYTETDNGTNPKEYYGGISEVGDEALKEMFGVNDVAPNSMNYVDYHKDVKFDGKATEYGNSPYTNSFLFAVKSGGNTTIYDSSDKTKRQCVVINGAVTASTTTMQELVVGAGGATVTLKDGENSSIPYVVNGTTSESGRVTLNEGDIIHIKEYSEGSNYYNNAYQNVPYFMSTDTNCINDYLTDGLFAAPNGENGAISSVIVMAGSGIINYTKANYSYQKEYKFTCRYSDPNYNQKCVEATYGYATWDSTLHADKLNPVKDKISDEWTVLNVMQPLSTDDMITYLAKQLYGKDRVIGIYTIRSDTTPVTHDYWKYLYDKEEMKLNTKVYNGEVQLKYRVDNYIKYKKYIENGDNFLILYFKFNLGNDGTDNEVRERKFKLIYSDNGAAVEIQRIFETYTQKPFNYGNSFIGGVQNVETVLGDIISKINLHSDSGDLGAYVYSNIISNYRIRLSLDNFQTHIDLSNIFYITYGDAGNCFIHIRDYKNSGTIKLNNITYKIEYLYEEGSGNNSVLHGLLSHNNNGACEYTEITSSMLQGHEMLDTIPTTPTINALIF